MKLTKGMKKALSLLLTGALAISGANAGVIANAEEAANSVVVSVGINDEGWNDLVEEVEVTGVGEYSVKFEGLNTGALHNAGFFGVTPAAIVSEMTVAMGTLVVNDTYEMTFVEDYSALDLLDNQKNGMANIWNDAGKADEVATGEDASLKGDDGETIALYVGEEKTNITSLEYNFEVTSLVFVGEEPEETVAPSADAEETTAPTSGAAASADPEATPEATPEGGEEADDRTTAESFDLVYHLTDPSWGSYDSDVVTVTGNGTYAISGTATAEMEDIMMLWLDAGSLGYDNDKNIVVESTVIQVGEAVYAADANWWYRDCDSLEKAANGTAIKESDGMKEMCRRMNYRNQYNQWYDAEGNEVADKSPVDAFGREIAIAEGDVVTLYVKVSGMAEDNAEADITIPDEKEPVAPTAPAESNAPAGSTQPSASAPAGSNAPSASAPAGTTSGNAITTPASIASPASAELTVAKKAVTIAAGKKASVKYTVTAQKPATQAAVVTATVAGKKVTAVLKDGKVVISVGKKAVKGSKATVTLTTKNASGKAIDATIKVTVQNKAKKFKAPKKVTIKKNKTAKVVIKIKKAENNKKAITDKITAKINKKKIAKVLTKKTQWKKGKVILTLKAGKKKGSAKMTVKVGSIKKKAKINIKVK